jgi:regulator of RNase E activity RraA
MNESVNHPELSRYETATLYDAARRVGVSAGMSNVLPLAPGLKVIGPAYTVQFVAKESRPAASRSFYDVMASAPEGSVLVVQVGVDRWISGANMARFAQLAGIAGIVMDGCTRDVATIRSRGYPVFAKGVSVLGYSEFVTLADANVDIVCGGVGVSPNDIIVGDDDGVVVLPARRLDEIMYEADEIVQLDMTLAAGIEAKRPLAELDKTRLQWSRRRPAR